MSVVLDETEQKQADKNSKKPAEKAAWLVVNNKLWIFALCLLLIDVYQGWSNKRAFEAAMHTKEVVWIKMGPGGDSTVESFAPGDKPTFYKASVDSALERYLTSRYGVQPETVKKDYGVAGVFMSQPMYNLFLSTQKGGYNAVQKAADIQANPNSVNRVEIKWGFPNHYDSLPAVFGKEQTPGEMFKSNVYFTEITRSPNGIIVKDGVKQKIWRGEWHFLTQKELGKKSKEWLRANPVGIEIIKADVIDDPAGNEREEAN